MSWGAGKGGATPTGKSYFGVITSIGPKYGFIDCRPVKAQYGGDVFVPAMILQGFSQGMTVDFELAVNAQGKPQAHNVRAKGAGKGAGSGMMMGGGMMGGGIMGGGMKGKGKGPAVSEPLGSFFGVVETIGPKYGFIKCPPVFAEFKQDVFAPGAALRGLSVGDKVDFELVMNEQGQPQAKDLRRKGMAAGFGGGMAMAASFGAKGFGGKGFGGKGGGVSGKSKGKNYRGTVTSIGGKYGFIKCESVTAEYGCDVFVPISELMGSNPGEEVTFELFISDKGKPQGANVVSSGGGTGFALKSTSTGECFMGKVARSGGKFGFIKCDALAGRFDGDIFCPGASLVGMKTDDDVTFELFVNEKGQPQAGFVTKTGAAAAPTGETLNGTVASTGGKFGFIECAEIKAKYSSDVFVSGGLLMGIPKGTPVSFELGVSAKGQPQALSVTPIGNAAKRARTA